MHDGSDGFALARFSDKSEFKTECPNALLQLPNLMKRPNVIKRPASKRPPPQESEEERLAADENADEQGDVASEELAEDIADVHLENDETDGEPVAHTQVQPSVLKRPAAATSADVHLENVETDGEPVVHSQVQPSVVKRPAAATSARYYTEVPADARELRPNGCSKCRRRVGCTPSCWKNRVMPASNV